MRGREPRLLIAKTVQQWPVRGWIRLSKLKRVARHEVLFGHINPVIEEVAAHPLHIPSGEGPDSKAIVAKQLEAFSNARARLKLHILLHDVVEISLRGELSGLLDASHP